MKGEIMPSPRTSKTPEGRSSNTKNIAAKMLIGSAIFIVVLLVAQIPGYLMNNSTQNQEYDYSAVSEQLETASEQMAASKQAWIDECTLSDEGLRNYCTCVYETGVQEYSIDGFRNVMVRAESGDEGEEFNHIVSQCKHMVEA